MTPVLVFLWDRGYGFGFGFRVPDGTIALIGRLDMRPELEDVVDQSVDDGDRCGDDFDGNKNSNDHFGGGRLGAGNWLV